MSDHYSLQDTLKGYKNAINCIAFSPTGEFLATGGEDGVLHIWNPKDAKPLASVDVSSSILCLEWDPVRSKRIFFGCQNGTAAFVDDFGKTPAKSIQTGIEGGQVYALAVDGYFGYAGLSIGPEVHVARKLADGSYATFSILPEPRALPESTPNSDTRVRARSLQFVKRGSRLVVSYLNHGVVCWEIKDSKHLWRIVPAHENHHIGSSMLSPDGLSLLVSNLSNGMNLYSLKTLRVSKSYQYTVNPRTNFPLSVAYLRGGSFVTCGTHTGTVQIWDKETGEILQTLDHNSPLITCLAVHRSKGYEYIATATTGAAPEIKIWKAHAARTILEIAKEYGRCCTTWLDNSCDEQGARDIILVLAVAFGTYFFTVYTQKPSGIPSPSSPSPDVSRTSWLPIIVEYLGHFISVVMSMIGGLWEAAGQTLRRGIVKWLEIKPHEVHLDGDIDTVVSIATSAVASDLPYNLPPY